MGVILSGKHAKPTLSTELRDGPLENLYGVGGGRGAGEVQKNIRAREN